MLHNRHQNYLRPNQPAPKMQQDIQENRHNLGNNRYPKYHQQANRRLRNSQNHSFRVDPKAQDILEFYNIQTERQDQKCSTKDL